jgi:hypothetical protein
MKPADDQTRSDSAAEMGIERMRLPIELKKKRKLSFDLQRSPCPRGFTPRTFGTALCLLQGLRLLCTLSSGFLLLLHFFLFHSYLLPRKQNPLGSYPISYFTVPILCTESLSKFHLLCEGVLHEASAPALVKTERTRGVAFE